MKLSIDHNSPVPLYLQAEKLLRDMIALPEHQEGKLLPNEVDLANKLGISRNTLRQATNKLVYEGLIYRKKGVGTVVAKPVDSKATNWLSFTQEMESKGMQVVNYDIAHAWVVPDASVLNFMGLEEGTQVLKMDRLRGDETGPFVYFTSYFHPRTGLTGDEDFNKPLYNILQQDYSIIAKLSKEEIRAQACDKQMAERLNINIGDPILVRKRMVYDPGKRPIEYNVGYYVANSIVYTVESERDV